MAMFNIQSKLQRLKGGHQTLMDRLFVIKSADLVEVERPRIGYRRTLTCFDLVLLGVGGIIGAGIFIITGRAAHDLAGPSIVISFLISGFVCALAAICYAELASMIPLSGSAYTYTYSTMGEIVAWIIGWDLILEYLVGAAAVASAWSNYFVSFVHDASGRSDIFDPRLVNAPVQWINNPVPGFYPVVVVLPDGSQANAIVNLPAALISLLIMSVVAAGIRQSSTTLNIIVVLKFVCILIFIGTGLSYIQPANYTPFIPPYDPTTEAYGMAGMFKASLQVFYAYLGFDVVSATAQEARFPKRDVPIGIIGSLSICTLLYISVSVVLTGILPYQQIPTDAPVANAMRIVGAPALVPVIIEFGAVVGLASVMLVAMIGQPRIFQTMAQDGLLPEFLAKIHPRTRTPLPAVILSGMLCAVLGSVFPVGLLADLTSVGTLLAFILVSLSVWILRWRQPERERRFQIPGGFWIGGNLVPLLSATTSAALIWMGGNIAITLRVIIWLLIGLLGVYFPYGIWNSRNRYPLVPEKVNENSQSNSNSSDSHEPLVIDEHEAEPAN
ncbi:amino acid/polyamine transporter I [Polychytrium aggregatum]|uniref:amino acid/polyamine transporter I n=1 Tax=Polychytrium aggregatum TaxID=110093 RepID=UPI0022FE9FE1|nr:amino acid/polyamine transporter I [Polychytrium aggregatum]KAI9201854.1 amino acid/polyamine transporter I [Polychytrium aggregatum]